MTFTDERRDLSSPHCKRKRLFSEKKENLFIAALIIIIPLLLTAGLSLIGIFTAGMLLVALIRAFAQAFGLGKR